MKVSLSNMSTGKSVYAKEGSTSFMLLNKTDINFISYISYSIELGSDKYPLIFIHTRSTDTSKNESNHVIITIDGNVLLLFFYFKLNKQKSIWTTHFAYSVYLNIIWTSVPKKYRTFSS